jgi:hypothetical protein
MVNIGTAAQFYGSTFFYDGSTAAQYYAITAARFYSSTLF